MKIGNFSLLSYDLLTELINFFIGEGRTALLQERSDHATNGITFLENDEFFDSIDRLKKLHERLEQVSLSSDEKEIILTGGFILLSEITPPITDSDKWLNKLCSTFIKNKSVAEIILLMLKIHDDATAKWECILSYKLFNQDQDNYKTYPLRKDELTKEIYEKYGVDKYGRDINSEEVKAVQTLSFFPRFIKEPLFDGIIDNINTLTIQDFNFYPYWDLRDAFEKIVSSSRYFKQATDQFGFFYQHPETIECMKKLINYFNVLDQAVLPEHDKSLIATGALLTLSKRHYLPRGGHLDFEIFIKNKKFNANILDKARIAAIETYELYDENPDKYQIYSQRAKENSVSFNELQNNLKSYASNPSIMYAVPCDKNLATSKDIAEDVQRNSFHN